MADWNRWGMFGFAALGGAAVLAVLLSVVASIVRGRGTVRPTPGRSPGRALSASFGALLFTGLSLIGALAVLGILPVALFSWAAARRRDGDGRLLAVLAAVGWAGAALAQFATAEWSKTVQGAIRADVLLTGPALAVLTYLAVRAGAK